jgi:hypothetical protein
MQRTPDRVSKARQKLSREMAIWRAAIKTTKDPQKIAFGEAQLARCKREMRALGGKRRFWSPK